MMMRDVAGPRRWLRYAYSQFANRRIVFTFATIAILVAKTVHIYAHVAAVPRKSLVHWGYSLFAQDLALLVFIRTLLDPRVSRLHKFFQVIVNIVTSIFVTLNTALSLITITFYVATRSEIHWRNVLLVSDASSRALVLSATISFVCIVSANLFLSWLLQTVIFGLFGFGTDLAIGIFTFPWSVYRLIYPRPVPYAQLPQQDLETASKAYTDDGSIREDGFFHHDFTSRPPVFLTRMIHSLLSLLRVPINMWAAEWLVKLVFYLSVIAALLTGLIMSMVRPEEATLSFLAWTTVLLPFVDFSSSSKVLEGLKPTYNPALANLWPERTIVPVAPFEWMGTDGDITGSVPGFKPWFKNAPRYSPDKDPLRVPNLQEPVLAELKDALKDIDIRHVILVKLESTRNDVFPIKKDGLIWNRLADSWPKKTMPDDVAKMLSTLTPTANYITGDYDDGFEHEEKPRRGGINFKNAYTTGTYTLKSLTGSICGLTPLIADFNLDYNYEKYQPCLPHIFEAMNRVKKSDQDKGSPYVDSKWQSYFYQTATLQFDKFDLLMKSLGFPENNTVDTVYLRSKKAKHGPVSNENTNYFGFEEEPLEDYIRDAFDSAKENDERVFLTHITSTTHHPFVLPEGVDQVALGSGMKDISDYTNSVGYVDKWLQKLLNLLDDMKVADETLVIFTGDHGLTMPENDKLSTYYNPGHGANHVPLVLSHPKLPAIDVNDPVSSIQILPTILDILLETKSFDNTTQQVAHDLLSLYEGQSMIRPIQLTNKETGEANWQFTLVNPGHGMISVRDAREPDWNFVLPIVSNVEWKLSNIVEDPREQDAIEAISFKAFLQNVEERWGADRAKWAEEAAFKTRWWFERQNELWHYGWYDDGERV